MSVARSCVGGSGHSTPINRAHSMRASSKVRSCGAWSPSVLSVADGESMPDRDTNLKRKAEMIPAKKQPALVLPFVCRHKCLFLVTFCLIGPWVQSTHQARVRRQDTPVSDPLAFLSSFFCSADGSVAATAAANFSSRIWLQIRLSASRYARLQTKKTATRNK